jgi:hypothetical protein
MLTQTPDADRRNRNAARFNWHQHMIADRKLTAAALRFGGLVMHRFNVENGYAEISHRRAARLLGVTERTALRARNLLVKRGWLSHTNKTRRPSFANAKARYALGGGPDDLIFSAHADTGDSI